MMMPNFYLKQPVTVYCICVWRC